MCEASVILKKGEGRTIKAGGAWIFDNEIDIVKGSFEDGDIIDVLDFDGYRMGKGFINSASKIRVRMLTRNPDENVDEAFINMRVRNAWNYRKVVMNGGNTTGVQDGDLNCCRIIFGEADWLPGLVIDKYADVLVVESLALGIDKLKLSILHCLIEALAEDGISISAVYEKSDAPVRKKEGLLPYKGIIPMKQILGLSDNAQASEAETARVNSPVEIIENGVCYKVDVINGQKTGFFLDQKYNRLAMQRIVEGYIKSSMHGCDGVNIPTQEQVVKVLDCFTHMGTFALNCGLAIKRAALQDIDGAKKIAEGRYEVTGLDISEYAVSQATENARVNGLSQIVNFRAANVLDELPRLYEAGEKYDIVILDPPAFTKSREATKNAMKGYREINMKGMKLVRDGGYLATCSCSHFMTQELFIQVIGQAAKAVHKRLRQVELRTQAPDHPILWAADESYYLKFLIFQVVDEK